MGTGTGTSPPGGKGSAVGAGAVVRLCSTRATAALAPGESEGSTATVRCSSAEPAGGRRTAEHQGQGSALRASAEWQVQVQVRWHRPSSFRPWPSPHTLRSPSPPPPHTHSNQPT